MFSQRTAIVTGGTRGIGKAISTLLASEGANVAGESFLPQVQTNQKHIFVQHDVQHFEKRDWIEHVTQQLSTPPDILINAAGINYDHLLVRFPEEHVLSILNTNLTGTIFMTKTFVQYALRCKLSSASIINLSSIVGVQGAAGQSIYAASKAGVIGFTKSIAKEVASRNIRVNAVAPGYVETDMTRHLTEERKREILARTPMGRFATAEDVAHVVAFLASNQASFVTGQVIHVDGGAS